MIGKVSGEWANKKTIRMNEKAEKKNEISIHKETEMKKAT